MKFGSQIGIRSGIAVQQLFSTSLYARRSRVPSSMTALYSACGWNTSTGNKSLALTGRGCSLLQFATGIVEAKVVWWLCLRA